MSHLSQKILISCGVLVLGGCSGRVVESQGIRVTKVQHYHEGGLGYQGYVISFRADNLTPSAKRVRFRAGLISEFRAKYARRTAGDITAMEWELLQPGQTRKIQIRIPYSYDSVGFYRDVRAFVNPYVEILNVEDAPGHDSKSLVTHE